MANISKIIKSLEGFNFTKEANLLDEEFKSLTKDSSIHFRKRQEQLERATANRAKREGYETIGDIDGENYYINGSNNFSASGYRTYSRENRKKQRQIASQGFDGLEQIRNSRLFPDSHTSQKLQSPTKDYKYKVKDSNPIADEDFDTIKNAEESIKGNDIPFNDTMNWNTENIIDDIKSTRKLEKPKVKDFDDVESYAEAKAAWKRKKIDQKFNNLEKEFKVDSPSEELKKKFARTTKYNGNMDDFTMDKGNELLKEMRANEKSRIKNEPNLFDKSEYYRIPQKVAMVGVPLWMVSNMSDSKGEMSNAELYGQQPMYNGGDTQY